MLSITVPAASLWDERNEQFLYTKETVLMLEHSLVSISKWESKWKIPFLGKNKHTADQMVDYIKCMTLNKNVDPNVYLCLTADNIQKITDYINEERTASTIKKPEQKRKTSGENVTSELIYYWMTALQIPFDPCQKWHLSRLLMLIEIAEIKNNPDKKKMSTKDIMKSNTSLNAKRRAALHSKG